MIDLQGRVALVTGGDRGIGWAVSEMLGRAHAEVAIGYHKNHEAAAEAVRAIHDDDGVAECFAADLRDEDQVREMVAAVIKCFGRIDILVNNAGIWTGGSVTELTRETLLDTLEVNVLGPIYCIKYATRDMLTRGFGRIINIGSTAGIRGEAGHSHYAASKGALLAATRSLARELGHGITVNMVSPGWIYTDMTSEVLTPERIGEIEKEIPTGRIGRAADVAGAVLFLASDLASQVNGVNIDVNGGAVFS